MRRLAALAVVVLALPFAAAYPVSTDGTHYDGVATRFGYDRAEEWFEPEDRYCPQTVTDFRLELTVLDVSPAVLVLDTDEEPRGAGAAFATYGRPGFIQTRDRDGCPDFGVFGLLVATPVRYRVTAVEE